MGWAKEIALPSQIVVMSMPRRWNSSMSALFYHDGIPSGGNGFRRTTAFREFKRMKDGRIPKINISEK
jgi:hypothetical protein